MSNLIKVNRTVEGIQQELIIEGINTRDFPDFCDAYISEARTNGRKSSEEYIDKINEDYELINKLIHENIH